MKEVFKDIPGYEGYYQVSNLGNIKSLDRLIKHWRGGNSLKKGHIISQTTHIKGYKRLKLLKYGKAITFQVHQLVAMAFLNHVINGHEKVVDHINNIKGDNRLVNLRVISNRENCYTHHIGTSKYKGVIWNTQKNKWTASMRIGKKKKHLGTFTNEEDARDAYQNAIKSLR